MMFPRIRTALFVLAALTLSSCSDSPTGPGGEENGEGGSRNHRRTVQPIPVLKDELEVN